MYTPIEYDPQAKIALYQAYALAAINAGHRSGTAASMASDMVRFTEAYMQEVLESAIAKQLQDDVLKCIGTMRDARIPSGVASFESVVFEWGADLSQVDVDLWEPTGTTTVDLSFHPDLDAGPFRTAVEDAIRRTLNIDPHSMEWAEYDPLADTTSKLTFKLPFAYTQQAKGVAA